MKSLNKYLLIVTLFFQCITFFGQDLNRLDSLKLRLAIEKTDTGRIVLYYRISYELQFSDPEQAMIYANKALEESERSSFKKGKGNTRIQFGNLAQLKGENDKAEEYYSRALVILDEINDLRGVAICYNNLGILAHNKNDFQKALEYYRKSLAINKRTGRKTGEASSLYGIGTLFENEDAISLLKLTENYYGLIKVYSTLGQTAELLDKDTLAIWFYNQSLKICEYIQSPSDQAGICYSIGRLMENSCNTDSAENKQLLTKSKILF